MSELALVVWLLSVASLILKLWMMERHSRALSKEVEQLNNDNWTLSKTYREIQVLNEWSPEIQKWVYLISFSNEGVWHQAETDHSGNPIHLLGGKVPPNLVQHVKTLQEERLKQSNLNPP
jgi:hypothetical protein